MVWSSLIVLGLAQACLAKPLVKRWDDFVEKHTWVQTPKGWEFHSPAPKDHSFNMRIALKQSNIDGLIEALYRVSDPMHESYGNHLSGEEVDALVAPHPDTVDLVEQWLSHHSIDTSSLTKSSSGDSVTLRVTVGQAEEMLGTTYNVYYHPESDDYVVRTLSYNVPSALHGHIDLVSPTTYFGTIKSMRTTSRLNTHNQVLQSEAERDTSELLSILAVPSSCKETITPACLKALYNTTSYTPTETSKNILGIVGYLEEYANTADLQTFYKKYLTAAEGSSFTVVEVNGGLNDQDDPGVEANLDVQYGGSISYPTPFIYYSVGGSPPYDPDSSTTSDTNEPYLNWLDYILNATTVPQTFSTSYGDDEQTVPYDYAVNVCNLFAQLGARGSSVLFSSGDDGVGNGSCESNNGTDAVVFQPNFPASCPYVTSVGATTSISPEVAASFSAGGFSNYFPRPSYQDSTVSSWLTSFGTKKYAGLYNRSSRAYPDVSAQGENFQVVVDGEVEGVDGTSCSSPTFAAIVSLLNDYRLSLGKSTLGFLNPFLYTNASSGLNDITSGDNPGCDTDGFSAGVGWDPVTGLGTPNFGLLQALIKNL